MPTYIPLDPDEGPTIWAIEEEVNMHTYEIVLGEDPENPRESFRLSRSEIQLLCELSEEKN